MLPAAPVAPALAPLSRSQAILLEGSYRGELDEVLPRLPAFDRVPFAAPGGIDNRFLDAIVRRAEPGRGLPAVHQALAWLAKKRKDPRERVKSVYDGFVAMREELEAEKAALARIWKKREAQLTRIQDGLLGVVGDLQGIDLVP